MKKNKKSNLVKNFVKKVALTAAIYLPFLGGVASAATSAIWTVSHGGTGKIQLNSDGTYYSTCVRLADYAYALCPSQSGTYARGTGGSSSYMYFYGSDGKQVTYRIGGPVSAPDTLTQIKNGNYYNGVIIKKGESFVCSEFYDSVYNFERGPVAYQCANSKVCAAGSNDILGVLSSTYVLIAETAPGYFIKGRCQ